MLKKVITLLLLLSNILNFSMHRYITTKLPANLQVSQISPHKRLRDLEKKIISSLQDYAPTTINISHQELQSKVLDLLKQNPQYDETFKRYTAYQEFEKLKMSPDVRVWVQDQQRIMILNEILQYCQEHPAETEEIMNFYNNMKNANSMIKEKLAEQPQHFQDFFNQQLQQYMQEPYLQSQIDASIRKKMLKKLFPLCVISLMITFECLNLTMHLLMVSRGQNIENQDLLEAIALLRDALDIPNIPIIQHKNNDLSPIAGYDYYASNVIILFPKFFEYSLPAQIKILLHEMRHVLQFNGTVDLSPELLEYAKQCNLELGLHLHELFQLAFFWSNPLKEFDADNFAFEQMKEHPSFEKIVHEKAWDEFYPNQGYFSKDMALKKLIPDQKTQANIPTSSAQSSNPYLQHIPEHLKQTAAKNRAARAQLAPQQPTETLFDRYLKQIEAEL